MIAVPVSAQLPLTIEQLLVEPRKWQLATSLDFFTTAAEVGVLQRAAGWRSGLRYGLAPGIEVNAGIQLADTQRRELLHKLATDHSGSQSLSAGVNWLLKRETATPAVLLELRAELARRDDGQPRALSGGQLMLTAYQSIDPVVLSMTAMWDQRRAYREGDERIEPGHSWRLEPAVNFAVNSRVTLLGGLAVSRRLATRVNGRIVNPPREDIALRTGVGFALRQHNRLFLSGSVAPGADAGSVNLQWFYEF